MRLWFKKTAEAGAGTEKATTESEAGAAAPADAAATQVVVTDAAPYSSSAQPAAKTDAAPAPIGPSARALFRQILDGQYDALLITDLKGHIVDTNRRIQDLFGYGPDETWDLSVSRLVPGITDTMIQQVLEGLASERHIMIEGRCTRKGEGTFQAEITISQIAFTNDGNLLFCIRNIDRRHLAMQRLQSARRLLDHISTPAAACDRESVVRVANMALARMLGHETPDALADQPFACVWNEPRAAEVVARVLGGETVKEPINVTNLRGKPLQLVMSLAPEQDARDKVVGFLASFTSAAVVTLGNN